MNRFLPACILFLIVSICAEAQQLPLYTQYVFNPYLINPSMVASNGRPEVNLLYRQQWTQIPNGPQTLQFDAQLPISGKMAIGVNVNNDKTVLLSATSAMITYGYRVQLAPDHGLGFGLSAGIFSNRVRLEEVSPADLGDLALTNVKNNNMAIDGQFGVNYTFRKFVLGLSMVNLFDRKDITAESFQKIKLSQLRNNIVFASYKFELVPQQWYFQPNVAYRMSQDGVNYFETSGLVSFRDLVQVGAGYRQNFGVTSMLRLGFGPISAGFAYDFPSPNAQVSTGGTREIQLKWIFGRVESTPQKKSPVSSRPMEENGIPPTKPEENISKKEEEKVPVVEEVKPEVKPEVKLEEKIAEPVIETPVVTQPEPPKVQYYLVAGTYESRENAEKMIRLLESKKLKGEIKESKEGIEPHYWYVIIPDYMSDDISVEKILEIQKKTGVKDAWYKKADWEE